MVLSWMVYATIVAAGSGLAALVVERALRMAGHPSRRVWTAATILAFAAPAAAWWAPGEGPPAAVDSGGLAVAVAPIPRALEATAAAWRTADPGRLDVPLLVGWASASAGLLIVLLAAGSRLAVARRAWSRTELHGVPVRVSRLLGPAAVGLLRPEIVVPRWLLDAPEETHALVLAHEREHIEARDPARVGLSLLAVVICPWNPALWWHLRRVRLSVEIDCDARVLVGVDEPGVRRYGRVLLEVGMRSSGRLALPAFAEGSDSLEERIRWMTRGRPTAPLRRAAALGVAGAVLAVAACFLPGPDRRPSPTAFAAEEPLPSTPHASSGSPATAFTQAPVVANPRQVRAEAARAYPAALREAGTSGRVLVHVFVDSDGVPGVVRLDETSGEPRLDDAALRVARTMRFEPALRDGEPAATWVRMPIRFGAR